MFGRILLERNFGQPSEEGRPMCKNQYSPRIYSERPSGLCATLRPHQMPCENATSHEYSIDTFRAKTDVSNHVTEPVSLSALKPQL